MNPNADKTNLGMNSMPVAQPAPEVTPGAGAHVESFSSVAEQQPRAAVPIFPMVQDDSAAAVVSQPAIAAGVTPDDIQNGGAAADLADDSDLIEKEWVTKAKQIIQGTVNDPYHQNQQLNLLKADYMQKRYHKTIKLS